MAVIKKQSQIQRLIQRFILLAILGIVVHSAVVTGAQNRTPVSVPSAANTTTVDKSIHNATAPAPMPSAATSTVPQKAPELPDARSTSLVEKLIRPYKFKEDFSGGWRFYRVEKYDSANIVFSLATKDSDISGNKLFVWLTSKTNATGVQAKSKSFNIMLIVENSDSRSPAVKDTSSKLISLIKNNDTGTLKLRPLKEEEKSKGISVSLPPPPQVSPKSNQKSTFKMRINPFRLAWIILLVVLVAAIVIKIVRRLKARTGAATH